MTEKKNIHPYINLIKAHADCQAGMYLNGTYRNTTWFGGFSDIVSDSFWNFAVPLVRSPEDSGSMVEFFERVERTPALYGEMEFVGQVIDEMEIKDCEVAYQDVWMEYTSQEIETQATELEIVDVRDSGQIIDFVDVFKSAYGDTDADDPYAGLPPTYIKALEAGLESSNLGQYDTHLIAKEGETPVSIGSIIQSRGVAVIYNMGTIPSRQDEGIGTRIAERLIDDMLRSGVDNILLQTEPESYVEEFYADMGFDRNFEAQGVVGGSWDDRFDA